MPVNLTPPRALAPVDGIRLGAVQAIKSKRREDLTVMEIAAGSAVAAVFTQNRYPAPPVTVCRRHLGLDAAGGSDSIRALAINAGIANAGTLGAGLKDAEDSCRMLARLLRCRPAQVLPFSTGVIMERLPMQRYAEGLARCVKKLSADNWLPAARAIMTTDTQPKGVSAKSGAFAISGIAKGSGMIHPNMATMLAFVATDAAVPPPLLARWQKDIARDTFNTISVDGDTSTNDSFVLIATGRAGAPRAAGSAGELRALKTALTDCCAALAQAIVRDGEGASKFVTVRVRGGRSRAVCRRVAEAVARSPLVKTALAASDANVGRFLMALGNAGQGFEAAAVSLHIGGLPVLAAGGIHPQYSEKQTARALQQAEITVEINIGSGKAAAVMHTCDLTREYVSINADYRS